MKVTRFSKIPTAERLCIRIHLLQPEKVVIEELLMEGCNPSNVLLECPKGLFLAFYNRIENILIKKWFDILTSQIFIFHFQLSGP